MVPSSTRQVPGLWNSGVNKRAPSPCAVSHNALAVTTPAANAMRAWPKLSAIEPITTMSSQKCGLITENLNSLNTQITDQNARIDAEQERIDALEERLIAQMAAADAAIAELEQKVNYINGLFESMRTAAKSYSA